MKKILAVILCLTFVLAAFGSMAVLAEEAAPVEGFTRDDEKKELRASTADGLLAVSKAVNTDGLYDYNIFIDADIDMSGKDWDPIAKAGGKGLYYGTLDGQGHTITGLAVQDYANALGFIGFARVGCVVKNLHLVGVNFSSTKPYNGAIIGRIDACSETQGEAVRIENCTVQGRLSTTSNYAGGLVGAFVSNLKPSNYGIETAVDEESGKPYWYAPHLVVENCAVDMILYSEVNYAAGIIAGDSWKELDSSSVASNGYALYPDDIPSITCKNVFVTGTYKAPEGCQASGFIGYMNLAKIELENCFSAAEIRGGADVSGSFLSSAKKSMVSIKNCYSMSNMPFCGWIESIALLKDSQGNLMDSLNIVNCYAMKIGSDPVKLCTKLRTLMMPADLAADATEEEKAAYAAAVELYNKYVVVTLQGKNYLIKDVADTTNATPTEDGKYWDILDINLTVPSYSEKEMVSKAGSAAATYFKAGSKQKALVEAYLATLSCDHTNLRELVDGKYLATNATCIELATYFKSCDVCGKAMDETFETGELKDHTWSSKWRGDDKTHYYQCTYCKDAKKDEAPHTFGDWTVVRPATVERVGKEERLCTVCEAKEEREIAKLDPPATEAPKSEGGCGGAIGGASIIIMLAAAGAVVLRKKED